MPTPANRAALYSSASDDWPTPADFYDRLDAEFGFALDVCSSTTNHKAPQFYALDHPDETRRDGLARDWVADIRTQTGELAGAVWMNPPYGRNVIEHWMAKAFEVARAGATVVCLVPVRASSAWFHQFVFASGAETRWVQGRLTFGEAKTSAPFASIVVIFRPTDVLGAPGPVATMQARDRSAAVPTAKTETAAPPATEPTAEPAADITGNATDAPRPFSLPAAVSTPTGTPSTRPLRHSSTRRHPAPARRPHRPSTTAEAAWTEGTCRLGLPTNPSKGSPSGIAIPLPPTNPEPTIEHLFEHQDIRPPHQQEAAR